MADFAQKPDAKYSQKDEALRALREVTGYRLYLDLERGWRVTMPNLEQTGLLRIKYRDLPEVAADEEAWEGATRRCATTSRSTGRRSPPHCSTSCAATWRSTSSTSPRTASTWSGACPRST